MNRKKLCKKHGIDNKELLKSIDEVLSGGIGKVSNALHMVAITELLIHGDI